MIVCSGKSNSRRCKLKSSQRGLLFLWIYRCSQWFLKNKKLFCCQSSSSLWSFNFMITCIWQQLGRKIHFLHVFYVAKKCTSTDMFCRLSSFASKQLLAGNPNMADLSDKNRPTKIGEKFGLLFDEEWSEAFESFNEKLRFPEEECLRVLSKILRVRTSYLFFWQNYYTYKIFSN